MTNNGSNQWMPLVGGVLNIISGVFGIVGSLVLFICVPFFQSIVLDASEFDGLDPDALMTMLAVSFVVSGIIMLVPSLLSIIGGVFAIKRTRWGWALAGSICSAFCSTILGIIAIIFIAMSKNEFTKVNPQPEPPGTR